MSAQAPAPDPSASAAAIKPSGSAAPASQSDAPPPRAAGPVEPHDIALIAHDNKKDDLLAWVRYNKGTLSAHRLYATGTTGMMLSHELHLPVSRFLSGPVGGDQQIGAKIAEGGLSMLIFFWDPLEPQPHDPDVKALLRLATVWNVPMACNVATADMVISSPMFKSGPVHNRPAHGPRVWAPDA